mmetsp:Transcript_71800/g.149986  ORF Transcript_71800/g.149986 Transcript_71800/m.149986 type:complete len:276 (-) Transcript_71800:412-1239(-)
MRLSQVLFFLLCASSTPSAPAFNSPLPTEWMTLQLRQRSMQSPSNGATCGAFSSVQFESRSALRLRPSGRSQVSCLCKDSRDRQFGTATEQDVTTDSGGEDLAHQNSSSHFTEFDVEESSEEDQLGLLLEDMLQQDMETTDVMTVQNDVSILCIYSLSYAIFEILGEGPKDYPGLTMEDCVMIGRYFTNAASLGCAWILAGLATSLFKRKGRDLAEVVESDLKIVVFTWLIAAPLALGMRAVGGVDATAFEGARDALASLSLMLLWRCIEPFLYM